MGVNLTRKIMHSAMFHVRIRKSQMRWSSCHELLLIMMTRGKPFTWFSKNYDFFKKRSFVGNIKVIIHNAFSSLMSVTDRHKKRSDTIDSFSFSFIRLSKCHVERIKRLNDLIIWCTEISKVTWTNSTQSNEKSNHPLWSLLTSDNNNHIWSDVSHWASLWSFSDPSPPHYLLFPLPHPIQSH